MSNVNNLYSLLGGKWMITSEYARSLYPHLPVLLSKGELPIQEVTKEASYHFSTAQGVLSTISEAAETTEQQVAVLAIKTPIYKYSQSCGPTGTQTMMEIMKNWEDNKNIAGVLLDVDSGGGQVAGTAEFANFLHHYSKPVVTYTDGMICSAAYYIASATNEIIANPHAADIGSIGTMLKYVNLDSYYEKMGAKVIEAYATKSTHKNKDYRDAAKGDLTTYIKESLDPINDKFHNDIRTYRPQVQEENFNGHTTIDMNKALKLGLIDTIADKQHAIARVFELAETNNTNTKNINQETMNKFNLTAALIGKEKLQASGGLFKGAKSYSFTEEELTAAEGKLGEFEQQLQAAEDSATAQTNKATGLETKLKQIDTAVATALKTANIPAAADAQSSIALLAQKVVEYGAQPGATNKPIETKGDNFEAEAQDYSLYNELQD